MMNFAGFCKGRGAQQAQTGGLFESGRPMTLRDFSEEHRPTSRDNVFYEKKIIRFRMTKTTLLAPFQ